MENIIDFLLVHWIPSALFITLFIFYLAVELFVGQSDDKISPQLAVALMNHQHAVIVDIRPKEVFDASHIIDAINIPKDKLVESHKKLQKYIKKPIIIVAAVDKDGGKLIKELQAHDFQQVLQLTGGMQEWVASGLPTTSSERISTKSTH